MFRGKSQGKAVLPPVEVKNGEMPQRLKLVTRAGTGINGKRRKQRLAKIPKRQQCKVGRLSKTVNASSKMPVGSVVEELEPKNQNQNKVNPVRRKVSCGWVYQNCSLF